MHSSLLILVIGFDGAFAFRGSRKAAAPAKTESITDPIPCRDDFAIVAQQKFVKTGKAAEVGVFQGSFSEKNLHHWQGQYYMIDAWSFRPGDIGDKNYKDDSMNDANMNKAKQRTKFAGDRRHVIQALSTDGAKKFESDSMDWVYLDALHTYDALKSDLHAWYPKLRPGGLMSGDDYGDMKDTNMVNASRWEKMYGPVAKKPENQWGVIRALKEFTTEHNIQLHVTWLNDCYAYNAWYFVKPE